MGPRYTGLFSCTICAIRKKWIEAVFVIATLNSSIPAGVLKVLVGRSRPPGFSLDPSYIFGSISQYSYPRGHVLFFVVFFGFTALLACRFLAGWMWRITISICAALILLIGPSCIYLGAHWFSDVIGSYIPGTFWLIILIPSLPESGFHEERVIGHRRRFREQYVPEYT